MLGKFPLTTDLRVAQTRESAQTIRFLSSVEVIYTQVRFVR